MDILEWYDHGTTTVKDERSGGNPTTSPSPPSDSAPHYFGPYRARGNPWEHVVPNRAYTPGIDSCLATAKLQRQRWLTRSEVDNLVDLYATGINARQLAAAFGINRDTAGWRLGSGQKCEVAES